MDVCVTVPKNFTHPAAPGKRGLAAWLAEGDAPGQPWSGDEWEFTTWGMRPSIRPGERVYVVCEGRLVGYAPLVELWDDDRNPGRLTFVRRGGAVACTIDRPITGFRGWRYRDWERAEEKPLDLSAYLPAARDADAAEPCCHCGRPSTTYYADDESLPSCGRPACELQMQRGLDYMDEVGNR